MDNRYGPINIEMMAEFLKLRRKTQSTTVLFLGSRVGGLFRSNFLSDTLCPFSTNFDILSPLQKFAACFRILNRDMWSSGNIYEILRIALNQVKVENVDVCVAELAKRRFVNELVTTNIDNMLEQAFVLTGLREQRGFDVFIAENNTKKKKPVRYTSKNSSFTLIKAFGDLAAGEDIVNSRIRHLDAVEDLNKLVGNIRNENILIVGLDPVWDQHIIPVLFPCNGTVWYVNEELPPKDSFLADHLQACKAQWIIGPEGRYKRFFSDLYGLVVDSSDLHPLTSNTKQAQDADFTGPLSPVRYTQQAIILQESLETQAEKVRSKEPHSPQSLQATVQILYAHLPSGVLAYYDEMTPLVKYEIINEMAETVNLVLTTEIKGFSHPRIDTVEVPARSRSIRYQLPLLDREKVGLLTDTKPACVHTRVSYLKEGVEFLYNSRNFDVYFMARNVIRWAVPWGSGYFSLLTHIAAWVTPHHESVKAMLCYAIDYHPRKALVGYPQNPNADIPRSQVKAIFQALKKVGKIAHTDLPFAVGPSGKDALQIVQLPDETLQEHRANCIDSTVLYASLIECISLHPVIVIQTGHAFVGWKISQDSTSYEFLETTMTLSHSFDQAHAKGMEQYCYLQENGWFKRNLFDSRGFARLLDIKMLRDAGIFPME